MPKSVITLLSNAKTRTLVLLVGGALVTGIIIAILSSGKTGEPLENKPSNAAAVPENVESTPGAKTSERYRELQQEANTKGSKVAEKAGNTFVPTIVGNSNAIDTNNPANTAGNKKEDLQKELLQAIDINNKATANAINEGKSTIQKNPQLDSLLKQQKVDTDNTNNENRRRLAEADAERLAALNEKKLRSIEQAAQAMEQQASVAFKAWSEVSPQQYIAGSWESDEEKRKTADINKATASNMHDKVNKPVILKAGSIVFAVLETAVNSDEPGPTMARIVEGQLKDAKLIGSIEVPANGEKIILNFNTLNIPSEASSTKISAVAIDPDTARTALASDVDNHYFLRWSSLFASAFMEGYAKSVSKVGTTVYTNATPGANSTTTIQQALSPRQQVFEGLGKVGEKWGDKISENFNRKPTITINSGISIGVLITTDLRLGEEPTSTVNPSHQVVNGQMANMSNNTTNPTTKLPVEQDIASSKK